MVTRAHTHTTTAALQSYSGNASVHSHWALSQKLQGLLSLSHTLRSTQLTPSPSLLHAHTHTLPFIAQSWNKKPTRAHTGTPHHSHLRSFLSLPLPSHPSVSPPVSPERPHFSKQIIHFSPWTHKWSHSFPTLLPDSPDTPPLLNIHLCHQTIFALFSF